MEQYEECSEDCCTTFSALSLQDVCVCLGVRWNIVHTWILLIQKLFLRMGLWLSRLHQTAPVRHTKSQRNSSRDHLNFFSAVLSKYQCHVSKIYILYILPLCFLCIVYVGKMICDLFLLSLRRHLSTRTPYSSYGWSHRNPNKHIDLLSAGRTCTVWPSCTHQDFCPFDKWKRIAEKIRPHGRVWTVTCLCADPLFNAWSLFLLSTIRQRMRGIKPNWAWRAWRPRRRGDLRTHQVDSKRKTHFTLITWVYAEIFV